MNGTTTALLIAAAIAAYLLVSTMTEKDIEMVARAQTHHTTENHQ